MYYQANGLPHKPFLNEYTLHKLKRIAIFMMAASALFVLFSFLSPAEAAGGLTKAKSGMERIVAEVKPIIRWGAILAILGFGLGYLAGWVDKSMAVKVIVGLIIIASANEIVDFFWVGTA